MFSVDNNMSTVSLTLRHLKIIIIIMHRSQPYNHMALVDSNTLEPDSTSFCIFCSSID